MEIVLEEAAVYCLLVITCSTSFIAIVFYLLCSLYAILSLTDMDEMKEIRLL